MGRVEAFEAAMKSLEAAIKPLLVGREQVRMKIDANGGQ